VIEDFAKPLKIIRNDTLHWGVGKSINSNNIPL